MEATWRGRLLSSHNQSLRCVVFFLWLASASLIVKPHFVMSHWREYIFHSNLVQVLVQSFPILIVSLQLLSEWCACNHCHRWAYVYRECHKNSEFESLFRRSPTYRKIQNLHVQMLLGSYISTENFPGGGEIGLSKLRQRGKNGGLLGEFPPFPLCWCMTGVLYHPCKAFV